MANANRMQSIVDELEAFDREINELKSQRAARVKELKGEGFPMKQVELAIKRRKRDRALVDEDDALLDIIERSLDGEDPRELGPAALKRLAKAAGEHPSLFGDDEIESAAPAPEADQPIDTLDEAKAKGAAAAQSGVPVTANPYPPRTPQRAAWDSAWCQAAGNDGMELPDAWKPTPKPKKTKGKGEGGESGEGAEGGDE